tara:strand:- start:1148 stop:1555 length:408 start_codon:yes stop_codon:yes gene_type:complete
MTPDTEVTTLVVLVNDLFKRCTRDEEFPDRRGLVENIDVVPFVCTNNFMSILVKEDGGTERTLPFARTAVMIHQAMSHGLDVADDLRYCITIPTEVNALEPSEPMDVFLQKVPHPTPITCVTVLVRLWIGRRLFP